MDRNCRRVKRRAKSLSRNTVLTLPGDPYHLPVFTRSRLLCIRARLQPCHKRPVRRTAPYCRRPEWRRSRNDSICPGSDPRASRGSEPGLSDARSASIFAPCGREFRSTGYNKNRGTKRPGRKRPGLLHLCFEKTLLSPLKSMTAQ